MSTIDIAKQSSVEELINRGCVKSVQSGVAIFEPNDEGSQSAITLDISPVNQNKSIVIGTSEELYNCHTDMNLDMMKQHLAWLSGSNKLTIYSTYMTPIRTCYTWQVIEFY